MGTRRALCTFWVAAALGILSVPLAAAGQVCVGDCHRDGIVTIDDLVRGVSIALEADVVTACPEFDANADGRVTTDELVQAVRIALLGCPFRTPPPTRTKTSTRTPTATHPPTSTPTVTPTATATPTASVTPTASQTTTATASSTPTTGMLNVSGPWLEEDPELVSSTCSAQINNAIREALATLPPCLDMVSQEGSRVTVVDCNGVSADGEIDQEGLLQLTLPVESTTQMGCTVTVRAEATADMSRSPTTLREAATASFSGTCRMPSCMLVIDARWTKQS